MRIIFMGTPEFAVPSLEALHQGGHEVVLVVTQPDRPKGRGRKQAASAVKVKAEELGLPLAQPESLKTPEFHNLIEEQKADLLVVVAFRILPESLFPLTTHGAVNLHASLLPRYRGAAPIQWAIARGETKTGVTIFRLDRLIDHGGILAQYATPIHPDETAGELSERLQILGRDLLLATVDQIDAGAIEPAEQNHILSCPAPKLKKEDGLLDWNQPSQVIHNRIRAFNPAPVCYSYLASDPQKPFRIFRGQLTERPSPVPGIVEVSEDGYPLVGCADRMVKLLEVQPEGKPKMRGKDFLNGIRDRSALRFMVKENKSGWDDSEQ